MGLIINGTPPNKIKVNSVSQSATNLDLKVLKQKKNNIETPVWGIPASLSLQYNRSAVEVIVNRISSPNQQASLGNVTDGSLVYYGDVLEISANLTDTSYQITSFTVSGYAWTNGQQFTVTSSAILVVKVVVESQPQWRTLWSGSYNSGLISQTAGTTEVVNAYDKVGITVEETVNPYPVRLTGRLIVGDGSRQFIDLEIPNVNDTPNSVSITVSGDVYILDEVFASETVTLKMVQSAMGSALSMVFKNETGKIAYQYYITKIEQYY